MKDLEGSPRQIAWASQIRAAEIKRLEDEISRNNARIAEINAIDAALPDSGRGGVERNAEGLAGQNAYYQWIIDTLGEIASSAQIIEEARGIADRAIRSHHAIINGKLIRLDTGEVRRTFE